MAASQTIVRKVRGDSDPASHRFVILVETTVDATGRLFMFKPIAPEMTLSEVCTALIAEGLSEDDALSLIKAAVVSSDRA